MDGLTDANKYLEGNSVKIKIISMYKFMTPIISDFQKHINTDIDSFLVEAETRFLRCCDLLLVDLSKKDWQYVGSLMEIVYAYLYGIPIYVVGENAIVYRKWLKAHATKIFAHLENAIKHIEIYFRSLLKVS
ncbi:MAG: hypothetical protein OMM_06445 [Candidatus Magnetoglobus multicellularis str. Araruama]|uniref:Uncharacterized protein n=1 Tax=Candidatus Magnetoglobus multicellularis str. Araruama TaxID=890399 RepID=A0A1V1PH64_9BACT|nr:MAG: hypothetical protein OMM_06445 [Candidatus Magnetoglobus multicellularis str. Araruama]